MNLIDSMIESVVDIKVWTSEGDIKSGLLNLDLTKVNLG